jgi:hypothetical protein
MVTRPSKPGVPGSSPGGRATVIIGVFAHDGRQDPQSVSVATPQKSTGIQHTPPAAAGTAGTRLGGGALAVLLVVLWLVTASLYRWAERPVEVEAPPAQDGGELWA